MKNIVLLGFAALLVLPFALSGESATAQDQEPTPLQRAMGSLNGNARKLRKLTADPVANKDALLEAARAIQEAALAGFPHPPAAGPDMKGDAVATWNAEFKRSMLGLADAALELELATLAGDKDGVAAAHGKLGELKKSGHDKFQKQW